ncbi:putative integral membrane cytochrome D ubiquinol oxidase (Subunit I) CydA [Flavimobilis marinus]|uniref:Cytochrome bd-I ubiquinol oxidase subunit 1 apoprotein n=1 Tax=Flavimobilis marinus TaxID=285351 RepID=A0A1I2G2W8_9MICO|nr:cytochrome ubiquinol oxidase subunit I [Flavimobilis marinus]GHG50355.1 putative integral membrane cytochrome D ubiquinol oxidase (Subunit I) CydA [Flavimobilis marinus]SFF11508.1 cytochrome bd-I ubiquinol oxidase subunit 1 apoprotein [Flavimobilis marinus]
MDVLDLARWQFAIVTVYHFIFVPLTIGLAPLVAIMQTAWVRTGNERWLRLTKFFGKLMLINFAIGVVTGIVQEFQFGMNWSEYSRFVGDVFGAPLAMEALAAFFIESTFLGVWIFGWDRISKKVHLACIWAVAIAVNISAYFILAANSWMQHPVGTIYNEETGRAELVDIWAVLSNSTLLAAFPHTVTAAFVTAGTFVAGIAAWWMVRLVRSKKPENIELARNVYRPAVVLGTVTMLVAGVGVAFTGHWQAQLMFEQQPPKMAAAEALCETETGASFSILTVGDLTGDCASVKHLISLPGLTSFLADNRFDSTVKGTEQLQEEYAEKFGATNPETGEELDYIPNLAITYWSFRLMIGFGAGSAALALVALWLTRRGKVSDNVWFSRLALIAIPTPFLASAFGWIFTEVGRQPWVVAPNPNPSGVDGVWMMTWRGISTNVSPAMVLTSMIAFTLLYGVLAVVWGKLMHRYAIEGVPTSVRDESPEANADGGDAPLSFAY